MQTPQPLNIYLKRYLRYAQYFLSWMILEKPRGLDFSMRAKSIGISSKGNHGYALTSRKALHNILRDLPITSNDSFLDIGCGKGGVCVFAADFAFGRIAGIEIEPQLVQIAKKNVEKLRLEKRVEIITADAATFERYDDFNVLFLFNPFDLDIYATVIDRVSKFAEQRGNAERPIWLLCYGVSNEDAIRKSDQFELYRDEICPYRGNAVRVWRSRRCGRPDSPAGARSAGL